MASLSSGAVALDVAVKDFVKSKTEEWRKNKRIPIRTICSAQKISTAAMRRKCADKLRSRISEEMLDPPNVELHSIRLPRRVISRKSRRNPIAIQNNVLDIKYLRFDPGTIGLTDGSLIASERPVLWKTTTLGSGEASCVFSFPYCIQDCLGYMYVACREQDSKDLIIVKYVVMFPLPSYISFILECYTCLASIPTSQCNFDYIHSVVTSALESRGRTLSQSSDIAGEWSKFCWEIDLSVRGVDSKGKTELIMQRVIAGSVCGDRRIVDGCYISERESFLETSCRPFSTPVEYPAFVMRQCAVCGFPYSEAYSAMSRLAVTAPVCVGCQDQSFSVRLVNDYWKVYSSERSIALAPVVYYGPESPWFTPCKTYHDGIVVETVPCIDQDLIPANTRMAGANLYQGTTMCRGENRIEHQCGEIYFATENEIVWNQPLAWSFSSSLTYASAYLVKDGVHSCYKRHGWEYLCWAKHLCPAVGFCENHTHSRVPGNWFINEKIPGGLLELFMLDGKLDPITCCWCQVSRIVDLPQFDTLAIRVTRSRARQTIPNAIRDSFLCADPEDSYIGDPVVYSDLFMQTHLQEMYDAARDRDFIFGAFNDLYIASARTSFSFAADLHQSINEIADEWIETERERLEMLEDLDTSDSEPETFEPPEDETPRIVHQVGERPVFQNKANDAGFEYHMLINDAQAAITKRENTTDWWEIHGKSLFMRKHMERMLLLRQHSDTQYCGVPYENILEAERLEGKRIEHQIGGYDMKTILGSITGTNNTATDFMQNIMQRLESIDQVVGDAQNRDKLVEILAETTARVNILMESVVKMRASAEQVSSVSEATGTAIQAFCYCGVISMAILIFLKIYGPCRRFVNDMLAEHQAGDPVEVIEITEEHTPSFFQKIIQGAIDLVEKVVTMPVSLGRTIKNRLPSFTDTCRTLFTFRQGALGLETFSEKISTLITTLFSWWSDESIVLTEEIAKERSDVADCTLALNTMRMFKDMDKNMITCDELRKTAFLSSYKTVSTFVDTYRGKADPKLRALVSCCDGVISTWSAGMMRSLFEDEHPSLQIHPIGACFAGPAGAGKSFFCHKLVDYICQRIKETWEIDVPLEKRIYMKNEKDQYFSGYADQLATLVDDLFSTRDSELPSLIMQLFGDSKVFCSFASLTDKGRSFASRFLLMTTNIPYCIPNTLSNHEALWRRRDFLYNMEINPVYKGSARTPQELSDVRAVFGNKDDYWIFQELNPVVENNLVGPVITSAQVIMENIFQYFKQKYESRYLRNLAPGDRPLFEPVKAGQNRFLAQGRNLLVMDPANPDRFLAVRGYDYLLDNDRVNVTAVSEADVDHPVSLMQYFCGQARITREAFWARVRLITEKFNVLPDPSDPEYERRSDRVQKFGAVLMFISGILGTVAAVLLLKWIVGKFLYWIYGFEHQSAPGRGKRVTVRGRPLVPRPVVAHQAGQLDGLTEQGQKLISRMAKNMVSLGYLLEEKHVSLGWGLFIRGHQCLMNKHVFEKLRKDFGVINVGAAINDSVHWNLNFRSSNLKIYDICVDSILVDFTGQSIQPFKDIVDHIVSEQDNLPVPGLGLFPSYDGSIVHYVTMPLTATLQLKGPDGLVDYYEYMVSSRHGWCGLPVLGRLADGRFKIIGIHSAGDWKGEFGLAVPLSREVIIDIPNQEFPVHQCGEELGAFTPPDNFYWWGKSEEATNFVFSKTDFVPSPISGLVTPVLDAPSILSQRDSELRADGRSPYDASLSAMYDETKPLDEDDLKQATGDIAGFFSSFPDREYYARICSDFEVLNGMGLPHTGHLEMQSSPGYPYKNFRSLPGKYDYIELIGDELHFRKEDKKGKLLWQRYRERDEAYHQGKRYKSLWLDGLKDEILPTEKVAIAKTRIFTYAPLDHLLISRKYNLGAIGYSMHNRVRNFQGPGIIESGADWTALYARVCSHPNIMCGDYKNFDKRVLAELIFAVSEVYNTFYSGKGATERHMVFDEIAYTPILCGDMFYWTGRSNKSGGCPTTPLNNIAQLIVIRYFYIRIMRKHGREDLIPWPVMMEHVYINVFGDDNIMSVSDEVAKYFNQITYAEALKEIGWIYTDTDKSSRLLKFKELSRATYLKRSFRVVEGTVLGILDLQNILGSLNWIRRKGDPKELMGMIITACLMELWKHGKPVYEEWVEKIRNTCEMKGLFFTYPPYGFWSLVWFMKLHQSGSALKIITSYDDMRRMGSEINWTFV